MRKSLSRIESALEAAKLYVVRYPAKGGAAVIRHIDSARVEVIKLKGQEPRYDKKGNEMQDCEACSKWFPLEVMHIVNDDGWFCPECIAGWRAEERRQIEQPK